MKLRQKMLLGISILFLGLLGVLYGVSQAILLQNFVRLEQQIAGQHIQRAVNVLTADLDNLRTIAADRAWNDAIYTALGEPGEDVTPAGLDDETFGILHLNLFALFDSNGAMRFSKGYDYEHAVVTAFPAELAPHLTLDNLLFSETTARTAHNGFLLLPDGLMMVATAPILPSAGDDAPGHGTLLVGRFLRDSEIQRLSELTRLDLSFAPFYTRDIRPDFAAARAALSDDRPVWFAPPQDDRIAGYVLVNDLYGKPGLILRVDLARDVYQQGQALLVNITIAIAGFSLIIVGCIAILLDRLVVARLLHLTTEVEKIDATNDLATARVMAEGRDELAALGTSINEFMASLYTSQQELALTQAQLAHSARLAAAGEVAAGVAHQINNPLTTVIAEAHLLLKTKDPADSDIESLVAIQDAAQRAGGIVQQMLDLARATPYEMEQIDVNLSLQNTLGLVKSQLAPYVQQLTVELAPDLPLIVASSQHLEDVVWINLLLNARDALRHQEDGQITVRTSYNEAAELITVSIVDNGAGIAAGDLPNLFTPFFTTKPQGTGLGLAICMDVVTRHHGTIDVVSELGTGTTFTVKLPITG